MWGYLYIIGACVSAGWAHSTVITQKPEYNRNDLVVLITVFIMGAFWPIWFFVSLIIFINKRIGNENNHER